MQLLCDTLAVAGLAAVVVGCAMFHLGLALIAAGVAFLLVACIGTMRLTDDS